MADFTATEVEDGTGLTTAVVYETVAATATWLVARGYASFNAATEAVKKNAALKATEELEDELLTLGFRGGEVTSGQGLRFPARGAYSQVGDLYDPDAVPAERLEAHRLACEKIVAGTWMPYAAASAVQTATTSEGASITYRGGNGANGLSRNHPEIYRRLRRCCPP